MVAVLLDVDDDTAIGLQRTREGRAMQRLLMWNIAVQRDDDEVMHRRQRALANEAGPVISRQHHLIDLVQCRPIISRSRRPIRQRDEGQER